MTRLRRVLVVEDNPFGREMLRLLLDAWGFDVQVAGDGGEGTRKALEWQPEAAVVDIGLPVLSGHDVARRLRDAFGRAIRLIALTAYHNERENALASGFDHFLIKPAEPEDLAKLLGHEA